MENELGLKLRMGNKVITGDFNMALYIGKRICTMECIKNVEVEILVDVWIILCVLTFVKNIGKYYTYFYKRKNIGC